MFITSQIRTKLRKTDDCRAIDVNTDGQLQYIDLRELRKHVRMAPRAFQSSTNFVLIPTKS